jgi:hypothetical protein
MSTVFTFWEPADAVVPYVGLCMKTWTRALRPDDIVVLNYANLRDHAGDALDLDRLRRAPLNVQKDAVMVAVLHRQGGLFLDADTLVVRDLAPLLAPLDRTEIVIVGQHLAFMAARPRARLLTRWLAMIQDRLAALPVPGPAVQPIPWDHLGNSLLYAVMDDVIRSDAQKPLPLAAVDRGIDLARRIVRGRGRLLARLMDGLLWRRRLLYFRTRYREYLTSVARDRHAFMPERLQARRPSGGVADLIDEYRRYWFEASSGDAPALRDGQLLIALHHSWTPAWYRRLSEREVLAHPCRLSRTLRRLLDG